MNTVRTVLLFTVLLAFGTSANAQNLKFFGQVRERSEFDGRSTYYGASFDAYHLLRTRLGLNAQLSKEVKAVIEVQDARYLGGEGTTTVAGSPNFDLRSGYIEAAGLLDDALTLRLGRMPLAYANERLIGFGDWTNTGQAFDGGIARIGGKELSVDVLGFAIARNANVSPLGMYGYNRDVFLTGFWAAWKPAEVKSTLQAYYLYDNPKNTMRKQFRHTAGIYASGIYGDVDFEIDGAHQFGTLRDAGATEDGSISANLIGIRAGYTLKDEYNLRFGIGFDYLSGSDMKDAKTYGAFEPLYGTKHKFLGFMDYFVSSASTMALGIQDIIVQASIVPDTDMKLAADFHLFSTVTDPKDDATLAAQFPDATKSIGMELDLTWGWKMLDVLNCTLGYSVFNGAADRVILTGKKTTKWGYFMVAVNI